jgi:hypothetical protein
MMSVLEDEWDEEDDMATVELTEAVEAGEALLADGRATALGIEVADRYRKVKEQIAILEKQAEGLRVRILAAAAQNPGVKSFPAGERVISISHQVRESVPLAKIRKDSEALYDLIDEQGYINRTDVQVLSVR